MKMELAIFDLAGTTIVDNNEVHEALIQAFHSENIAISQEEANAAMGIAKPVAIKQILENRSLPDTENFVEKIHDSFISDIHNYYINDPAVKEQPGTTELFKWLKSNSVKIGLDTGFDRKITTLVLKRMGWQELDLVDVSVCSDEVLYGRPQPDMIFRAMEFVDVKDSKNVMKVGDTPVDLLEGNNAKCHYVIGVLNGTHSREQLKKYPHTHLVNNLLEIKSILDPQFVSS